jgi:hypothetical protein
MARIDGGCWCGKARYTADAEPTFVAVCHCRACQKASGSAFAVIVALPANALTVTGEVGTHDSVGGSGKGKHHHFCPSCGSPVFSTVDAIPDMRMIRSGTLDDAEWVKPAMEIMCDEKQPWVALSGELKSFAGMPG